MKGEHNAMITRKSYYLMLIKMKRKISKEKFEYYKLAFAITDLGEILLHFSNLSMANIFQII